MWSSALRWPKVEAIEAMRKTSCSKRRSNAGSRGEGEDRDERELALLRMVMASSVWRKRAHWSSW